MRSDSFSLGREKSAKWMAIYLLFARQAYTATAAPPAQKNGPKRRLSLLNAFEPFRMMAASITRIFATCLDYKFSKQAGYINHHNFSMPERALVGHLAHKSSCHPKQSLDEGRGYCRSQPLSIEDPQNIAESSSNLQRIFEALRWTALSLLFFKWRSVQLQFMARDLSPLASHRCRAGPKVT